MRRFQPLPRGLAALALAGLTLACPTLAGSTTAGSTTAGSTTAGSTTAGSTTAGSTTAGLATARPTATTAPSWRIRDLARESATLRNSSQVISVARRDVFALLPTSPGSTRFQLERFAVTGGHVRRGPGFAVGQLVLAGGFLWVYGDALSGHKRGSGKQVLYQVSEHTLAVMWSWALPRHGAKFLDDVEVTVGPRHSVWVGFGQTLLRISTTTGAVIRRERVPAGVFVEGLATDPVARHLYVSTEPRRGGGTVFEYLARSGRQQAPAGGRAIRFALNSPALTGVPGGVFGLVRTGMAGEAFLLSQRGLRNQPLHHQVSAFFNFASAVYASKVLFLTKQGFAACISPGGAVRHTTSLAAAEDLSVLLAADASAHRVYALGSRGLIEITPPASCWG